MKQTVVAIYLRKSRSEEGLDALRNHKAVLTRLADQHGFKYDIYEEIGSSVSLDAREKLNEMLANIHKYKYVLVMDLDRLARSIVVMEEIKDTLRYNGVQIMTPQQTIDLSNESNEMLMDFQSVIAKAEYQLIKKRLRLGKLEGARRGHWVNGVAPLGYSYDKKLKKLVINQSEYPLAREIFNMALKNMSHSEIAINLNLRGFVTKNGNHFTSSSIKTILENRAYVGEVVYRQKAKTKDGEDEVLSTPNSHEPIVSELEFLEIQKLSQSRRTNFGKVTTIVKSSLQGLLYCGCCGSKLSIEYQKNSSTVFVKGCRRIDAYGEHCPNKSVAIKPIEDAVFAVVAQYKEQALAKVEELLHSDTGNSKVEFEASLKLKKAELKRQEDVLDTLLDNMLDGTITKEKYLQKKDQREDVIKVLKQDIRRIELQIESLDTVTQVDKLKQVVKVINNLKALDVQELNRFLMTIISKVVITSLPDKSKTYRRAKSEPVVEIYLAE